MITFPRRPAMGLATAAVLTFGALSTLPGSAGASAPAAPASDCAAHPAYTGALGDLTGQPVTGLTVVAGTTPDTFHGKVLGVVEQGIDLSTPLIMMKLGDNGIIDGSTPTAADDAITADGVWEGMSGSPVYTADGQLIGAVSTGFANGASDIIGITPATAMVPFLPGGDSPAAGTSPAWSHPSAAMTRQLAKVTGVSQARAAKGLRPLSALTERGLGTAALRHAQSAAKVKGLHKDLSTGQIAGASAQTSAPVDTMGAGGNVADMVVWGDYAEGGIGTVTTVCHNGLVAFGHPLDGTGPANDVLMSADAVYVQPDPVGVAFKMANLGVPAGTISRDYSTAIGGTFGALPKGTATFRHTASYDGSAPRTSVSYSADPYYWIDAAYYAADANDYTVMKAFMPGGGTVAFSITGKAHGKSFTLRHTDRYVSSESISDDSLLDMGNFVYALSSLPGVSISNVNTNSKLDDNASVLRITQVQQHIGGAWRKVDGNRPAIARAGRTLSLRAVAVGASGATSYIPVSVTVPNRVKGGHGTVQVLGGGSQDIPVWNVNSVAAAQKALAGATRNDQVSIRSTFVKGAARATSSKKSGLFTHVVKGSQVVPVIIG